MKNFNGIIKNSWILICFLVWIQPLFSEDSRTGKLNVEEPFSREKNMVVFIKYGNGYLNIAKSDPKMVFDGEFLYAEYKPDVRYEVVGDEGRLDIRFSGDVRDQDEEDSKHIDSVDKLYENEMNLKFSPRVPLDLNMDLGVIKGDLDFSGLMVEKFDIEVGVSKAEIYFNEPNPTSIESFDIEGGVGKLRIEKLGNANIQEMSFEGGIGSYELDFSGKYQQNLYAKMELGMGKLTLYIPRKIGTRISVDRSFLSSFSIDEAYKSGDVYTNDRWEKSKYQIDLDIESGVGKIDVIWVD
ncbi:MAG: hypothetical protein JSW33_11000 [bacterium]|nr:MAG: hypothetical protein JSW33_11000 [bacterium]